MVSTEIEKEIIPLFQRIHTNLKAGTSSPLKQGMPLKSRLKIENST